ncbi:DUF6326 family protein [Phenylobacterium terrae]|uniref:DUF6326 family protein n=1 Tax=Phenylobacterium terrae TaxID=2665495 RepID=A0ABW4MY99_9CAUL
MELADARIHVRLKLAALWTAVMLLYAYNDLFLLYTPGALEGVMAGKMGALPPTSQGLLFAFALSIAIPCLMIPMSLLLRAGAARWANIVVGAIYALMILGTLWGMWAFYIFLGLLEVAMTLAIVGLAWTWPRQAGDISGAPPG